MSGDVSQARARPRTGGWASQRDEIGSGPVCDQSYRVGHRDQVKSGGTTPRADGSATEHQEPLVRAMPGPTAHPSTEVWPGDGFARLQRRLVATAAPTLAPARWSVVVLPSRSVDRWHEPPAETRSYEERMLSVLLELRDPGLELTYVTSLPVAQRTVDYYISLLPPRLRGSARKRLRLVSLRDGGGRSLSEKLLARRRVLEQIRATLRRPSATYLLPYNSTVLERDIALALDIPVYGAHPDHAWLGTKSGARMLFARAGVPRPLGAEHVRSVADVTDAICRLRRAKSKLTELIIKIDNAVSGEGNALLDLTSLPAPGATGERELIGLRLERLAPEVDGVTPAAFLRKLAAEGGIVEERITAGEVRSPSVQLRITPTGAVELLSTHDQILDGRNGQRFAGCRFPADPVYAPAVSALAHRIAQQLADLGVIGPLAVDFLVARDQPDLWRPYALEVNLRMGGTSHPYQTLIRLTDGRYDPHTATFTTPRGQARHYVASDHLQTPRLQALGHAGLLARATRGDLRFDHKRGRGVVFHMLSSIEPLATVGVTAIAESPTNADDLYTHVRAVLNHPGQRRTLHQRPHPSPVLDALA